MGGIVRILKNVQVAVRKRRDERCKITERENNVREDKDFEK